tara:strand:- start:150 stop:1088 length:939 start_codon:yes stop_codon:yes gene_type:complete
MNQNNLILKKILINDKYQIDLRIDKWLRKNFESLSQSFIEKNLRKGYIKVNNKKVESKYKIQLNDEIKIFNFSKIIYKDKIKIRSNNNISSKYKKLFNSSILFENNDFIILNKWTGIATQGGSKINISIDSIIKNISEKYNLVHRLDRETSGLLIIAKNPYSTKYFGKIFKDHLIEKTYVAICQGKPKNLQSEVNLLVTKKNENTKFINTKTNFKVFQSKKNLTTIFFAPKTGKTHQIRIVAKHLASPIVGDLKYNKDTKYKIENLKLNAHRLCFTYQNRNYDFFSILPGHFINFLTKNKLKKFNKIDIINF